MTQRAAAVGGQALTPGGFLRRTRTGSKTPQPGRLQRDPGLHRRVGEKRARDHGDGEG